MTRIWKWWCPSKIWRGEQFVSKKRTMSIQRSTSFKEIAHISIGTPSKSPVGLISTSDSKSMGFEVAQDCKAARDQSCHPWLSGLVDRIASMPAFSSEVPGDSTSHFTASFTSEACGVVAVSWDSSASASFSSWACWQSPEWYLVQKGIWKSTSFPAIIYISWSWPYWSKSWEEWSNKNLTIER